MSESLKRVWQNRARPWPWALVGLSLALACNAVPPAPPASSFTGVPVAESSQAPTSGNPNAGSPNTPVVAQTPAVGTLTLSPKSNPYVCLTAASIAQSANVALATCSGDRRQSWLMQNSRLMMSPNLCLDIDPNVTTLVGSGPKLVACDANAQQQIVGRSGAAGLVIQDSGIGVALAAAMPTADASPVAWQNIDANSTGQAWVLGADSAASGLLVPGGVPISPSTAKALCLTGDANGVSYAACNGRAGQSWRWSADNELVTGGQCLTGSASGQLAVIPCAGDKSQRWYSLYNGLINLAALGCLDAAAPTDGKLATLVDCAGNANFHFSYGDVTVAAPR